MHLIRDLALTSLAFGATALVASPSLAASWKNNQAYGGSTPPTMDIYVPDTVDEVPGVVVSLHYCGGNSGAVHQWFESLSNQYGFIVIAPDNGPADCWDAKPERSGERQAITKMVQYAIDTYGADPTRVYAAGASSGACMTNALAAAYPDVFAGGAVLAGIPAGAWTTGGSCCGQNLNKTPQEWGDLVRNAFPNYAGARPRMQIFHGTADTTLAYTPNLQETEEEWSNVLGVTSADATEEQNMPKSGWTRTRYMLDGAEVLEINVGQGQPHDLSGLGLWPDVVRFFGLDQDTPVNPGTGGAGSGGGAATDGEPAVGGGSPAAGGSDPLGVGGAGTGGVAFPPAGGSVGAGGLVSTGGVNAGTGGLAASAGGAVTATGGTAAGTGGVVIDPGDGTGSDSPEGCSCQTAGTHKSITTFGALAGLLAGAVALRRRRSLS